MPIRFSEYGEESNPGPYPVPLNAPVEGAGEEGDRHVLVLQKGSCKLYELYAARRSGAGWEAGSGAVFNLRSNALRPEGWTSADAAGLPIQAPRRGAGAAAGTIEPELSDEQSVYRALVLGVRDYVNKHKFPGVVIGLSGGVDSALTLAIGGRCPRCGARARRHDAVTLYLGHEPRGCGGAGADAGRVAEFDLDREHVRGHAGCTAERSLPGAQPDATEENIQARCRGVLLMAISNKTGRMLLTTGNKSEMAVGYATLYGDMAGGFAPIKDCSKQLVYRLARYRNTVSPAIPERVITREPTAELRPDQKDTDSLPPYEMLDPILEAFIEDDLSVEEICERGFDRAVVARVLDMVKRAEYKRRQAPPGVRVSAARFRPRLALSDHQRLPALARAQPVSRQKTATSGWSAADRAAWTAGVVGRVDALARWRPDP